MAAMTLAGVEAGLTEVLVDEPSRAAKAGLSAAPA